MKDDIKVMARALCIMSLTLIVNLVFLHLIIYAAPQNGIEAIDAAGRGVRFDGDGNAVNVGPVRFLFDTDRLDDGEMYLYDDGESDLLNPVEDGEYDLFPEDKDAAVSFYKRSPERDDASLLGRPQGFTVTVREVYVSAGAGFVVALTGNVMTMPGLSKDPAAYHIDVDDDGVITGLF